ncbi:MAG: hypothetical protein IPP83_15130 [Flavobacteriales bacterium]|nr:hypothetical protein [Flavobacteriales bacterium]
MASTSAETIVLDTAAAYRTAIADYIIAMDSSDAPLPDTVYIGRHIEFPAIDLPGRIGKRVIRVITPVEAGALRDAEHFSWTTGGCPPKPPPGLSRSRGFCEAMATTPAEAGQALRLAAVITTPSFPGL